ncbi:hypothetical protein QAD02_019976 [Eretmocerus hayati]|uniref:Uncharacterized protein n=1 Tax=Eretmocerus hayati TaxID=131215 RepID=A0ACC2PNM1_9HYME|nr:hypothetical protein QAD02_019976 [Eretmocerus hayati]
MAEHHHFSSWLEELGCPQALTSDHVQKSLHKGILGLLWEELPQLVRPSSEVSEVRKNIVLYKLKHEPKDHIIQNVKNARKLREERAVMEAKIKKAEEQLAQQELICRQKANLMQKKKMNRQALETKKNILETKTDQMLLQMRDCTKMREICGHLMPPSGEQISQSKITECLTCIKSYSRGLETKLVWNKISGLLGPIKIPVLWNALLAEISLNKDRLIRLDVEGSQTQTSSEGESKSDFGIAELCSEHLDYVAQDVVYEEKMQKHETVVRSYLEMIDQIVERKRPYLDDWVPLMLEVRMLETKSSELKKELEYLDDQFSGNEKVCEDYLMKLVMDIEKVDVEITTKVDQIQRALGFLKTSRALILKKEKSLAFETEKLQHLESSEKIKWMDIDLRIEMSSFQCDIDIGALRKIILKGDSGIYKHLEMCLNSSSRMIDHQSGKDVSSNFPMLRVPLYYLVDLYKRFVASAILRNRIYEIIGNDEQDERVDDLSSPSTELLYSPITVIVANPYRSLHNLLKLANIKCTNTLEHNAEFEFILKAWSHQTVREVVLQILQDKTVDETNLQEWQIKFAMLPKILHKMIEKIP